MRGGRPTSAEGSKGRSWKDLCAQELFTLETKAEPGFKRLPVGFQFFPKYFERVFVPHETLCFLLQQNPQNLLHFSSRLMAA